jgi:uncharacterized membrane protein YoaK (UPF0700 family)
MAASSHRPVWLAVALILVGAALLLDRADLIDFEWSYMIVVIGLAIGVQGYVTKTRSSTFPAVFLTLLGLIFIGAEEHWFWWGWDEFWPFILIALGIAFFASAYVEREKGPSIPGVILTALGVLFALGTTDIVRWREVRDIVQWWPVLLIALGGWLLVRRK